MVFNIVMWLGYESPVIYKDRFFKQIDVKISDEINLVVDDEIDLNIVSSKTSVNIEDIELNTTNSVGLNLNCKK